MTNKYTKYGNTVIITVKQKEGDPFKVRIDADLFDKVDEFQRVFRIKGRCQSNYFAVCTKRDGFGKRETYQLNRVVNDTPDDEYCIFLNGDTTDCRKANLRNQKRLVPAVRKGKPHRPQYITWYALRKCWHVRLWDGNADSYTAKHVGYFTDLAEAVAARDKALKELGEADAA